MRRTTARSAVLAASALLGLTALTGCGPAPWDAGSSGSPRPSVTETVAPPVPNDLSGGSTQRDLTAGAVAASVNYWSALALDRWSPQAVKPISLSMVTTVTPDDGQKVYLQKATMVAVPGNANESFEALAAQTDAATVSPGYLVLDPYSYSQTFNVGSVPAEATFVTLQFTYDFLVQTTPTSNEFAKQTATDAVTVAIAVDGAPE